MDAVVLALPTAVAVPKLMGSVGFGGDVGVKVEKVEVCGSGHVSALVSSSNDTCSSSFRRKAYSSGSTFFNKMSDAAPCHHSSQLSSFRGESTLDLNMGTANSSIAPMSAPDAKPIQSKSGKLARSNNGSKRSRMVHMEISANGTTADDIKNLTDNLGSSPANRSMAEETQTGKHKSCLNGKRNDKKNGKVPKSKCDSFSLKAGLVSFSSASGGVGIAGLCGSKPDIYDVMKHVDELSLNELLDGSYKCPSLAKDKGKTAANLNKRILHSVQDACSVLQPRKPNQAQNFVETDSFTKASTCPLGSGSSVVGTNDSEAADTFPTNLSSCNKDLCSEPENNVKILDFPLYRPDNILGYLLLPPPKDLDSLLMDAVKPASSSRNNSHLRADKALSQQGVLPPFSWSHTSSGHWKSNSDTVKLSTSRSTCHGRWVRVGNPVTSQGEPVDFLAGLELLTYDHSLVPSGDQKLGPEINKDLPSTSISFTTQEWDSLSVAYSTAAQVTDGHSPTVLAAAQTLCEMANRLSKQNTNEMMSWVRKPVQKSYKSKSNKSSEKIFAAQKFATGPDSHVKTSSEMLPSKKLKLSANKTPDAMKKSSLAWSTPKSTRSAPCKSFKDLITGKMQDGNVVKKSYLIPSFTGAANKGCNTEQTSMKLLQMDWKRANG